jgi:iron complex transport system substrate-binding protein
MRIASLLPATTEWVCAFGAAGDLVARSHECHGPPGLDDVPVVTEATYDAPGADSRAIDDAVRARLDAGLSLYDVRTERLRALRPDVILTQTQCEVCAVSRAQLDEALAGWSDGEAPRLFSLAPATLKDVFEAGLAVGRAIGRAEAAVSFLAEKEKQLRALREHLPDADAETATRPTVACVEWLDPLMTAGHWTPGLARQAGGRAALGEEGERSQTVAWEDLRAADPDVLAVMPCGFSLEETRGELSALTGRPGFAELSAAREGRVYLFDGNAHFNRPGPRLYRSAELLAVALWPERADGFADPKPREMQRLADAVAA